MRVIITGGTGLIGQQLVKVLLADHHDVIVLSRNPDHYTLPESVRTRQWDGKTGRGWAHLIDAQTVLVNLAGENPAASRWTDDHKARVLESRLNATQAMLDGIEQASELPLALMQASAVGYYGDCGATPLPEDNPAGDNWRARVTVEWEAAAEAIAALGIRVCWLRIGIVLDQDGGALPSFIQAAQLMGRQLGHGQQWIPWVHKLDIAHTIRFLILKENASGPYNLCAPEPATNTNFMQTLASVMGRPALIPVPGFALKLALGEMATTVLDSQRVIPQRLLDAGYDFHFPDLDEALRDLLK